MSKLTKELYVQTDRPKHRKAMLLKVKRKLYVYGLDTLKEAQDSCLGRYLYFDFILASYGLYENIVLIHITAYFLILLGYCHLGRKFHFKNYIIKFNCMYIYICI